VLRVLCYSPLYPLLGVLPLDRYVRGMLVLRASVFVLPSRIRTLGRLPGALEYKVEKYKCLSSSSANIQYDSLNILSKIRILGK
jgi:hypothetical protein